MFDNKSRVPFVSEEVLIGFELPVHESKNTAKHLFFSFPLCAGGMKCITRYTRFLSLAALIG